MKRRIGSVLLVIVIVMVSVIAYIRSQRESEKGESVTKQLFAMDTVMSFTAYGYHREEAVNAAMQEIQRLDALLSVGSASSEVSQLNANGTGTLSEDTLQILKSATEVYEDTGGLFDYTIFPLVSLWGFNGDNPHVPEQEKIDDCLSLVDASRVQTDGSTVTLGDGQQVDFGGIAKGYASARVMEVFQEYGVESGMVSLGGNIQVLGSKPDGSAWRIGIRDPNGSELSYLLLLTVTDCAVVTSGGYERYFEEDGETYIHILDPRTGYPAQSDLVSATVVSTDGTLADGLSTALYIMGLEEAASYWRERSDLFDMVLITAAGEIYVTAGLQDICESENAFSVLK